MNIERNNMPTPIVRLEHFLPTNQLYIKRDDLYPFSFGGNKARKAKLFWQEVKKLKADYIVTYGSSSSNHCRVIANLAAMDQIPCLIISPSENSKITFNLKMMTLFGAKILQVPVTKVKETIDKVLQDLRDKGYHPYFIMGGGHGNIGTQAYVEVYKEIQDYEKKENLTFDYIFHASGTGTTQAGLVCGQMLSGETNRRIIGVSIARKNPYGREVVVQSVKDYLTACQKESLYSEYLVEFLDAYTEDGYGSDSITIQEYIQRMLILEGIPLDATYTGKAFAGMCDFVEKYKIHNKNILFLHTGGTPLFFDYLNSIGVNHDEYFGSKLWDKE